MIKIFFMILFIVKNNFSVLIDLALNQYSNQSSVYLNYQSSFAIDGKFEPNLEKLSCSNTLNEEKPWFIIILHKSYLLRTVRILNSLTNSENLSKLFVKTSLSSITYVDRYDKFEFFGYLEKSFGSTQSKTITANRIHYTRTILFYLNKNGPLILCEIEMWNLKNITKGKPTNRRQISLFRQNLNLLLMAIRIGDFKISKPHVPT